MSNPLLLQGVFLLLIGFLLHRYNAQRKALSNLPPGPKPLPFLGNILNMPPRGAPEFRHWLKHKDVYGSISSVTILGRTLVFLHGRDVAREILEKNARLTSGRPKVSYGVEAIGYGRSLAFQQNDERHERSRKAIHRHIEAPTAEARSFSIHHTEVWKSLLDILDSPDHLQQHLRRLATAIILKQTYGYTMDRTRVDPLVQLLKLNFENFATVAVPMPWLVDFFPILDYLPKGFPGTGFKKVAERWKAILQQVVDVPFHFALNRQNRLPDQSSFVSCLLQEAGQGQNQQTPDLSNDEEDFIKWTAATMYGAASDTSIAVLQGFFAAMVMYPDVQRQAQEEIDREVGSGRLPRLQDLPRLPYIAALAKEVYRWTSATPMGVPHMAQEDLYHNGYRIPKGSCLMPAVWWFNHDPQVHPDPDSFNPSRFLHPHNEPDPRSINFGFGRRVCPGQKFGEATVLTTILGILAVFKLGKPVDESGREVEINLSHHSGVICHLKDFPYHIEPRSSLHADLIRRVATEHQENGDAGALDLSKCGDF